MADRAGAALARPGGSAIARSSSGVKRQIPLRTWRGYAEVPYETVPKALWSGDSFHFPYQMQSRGLARYRRIAIDLPGHGASSRPVDPPTGYGLEKLADVVHAVAVRLDAEEAVCVGHSFGAHLLLQTAPLLPRAKGLLIFGAPP